MSNFYTIEDNNLYRIIVFDDGNQSLENRFINTWKIIATNKRGKVKLQNFYNTEFILESISSWKVKIFTKEK